MKKIFFVFFYLFFISTLVTDGLCKSGQLARNQQNLILVAEELRQYLLDMNYDAIIQKIMREKYKLATFSDDKYLFLRADDASLTELEKNIAEFFFFGHMINPDQIFKDASQKELLKKLLEFEIARKDNDEKIWLNNYWINSYSLANKEIMFIISDKPSIVGIRKTDGTLIFRTSHYLLSRIEDDYTMDVARSGIIADFGSGVGIQGIALLMLYSEITKVIGLEINEHSMNVSCFNAMLNNVYDRFVVLDNMDTENLTRELGRGKLSFAVSNPPFNAVPKALSEYFTDFGDGGPDGLDIKKIFLGQIHDHLEEGGEFLFYSVLVINKDNVFLLEEYMIKEMPQGYSVMFELESSPTNDIDFYASHYTDFLLKSNLELCGRKEEVKAKYLKGLEKEGITGFAHVFVNLSKVSKGLKTEFHRKSYSLPIREKEKTGVRGGVYKTIGVRGGVHIQNLQVLSIPSFTAGKRIAVKDFNGKKIIVWEWNMNNPATNKSIAKKIGLKSEHQAAIMERIPAFDSQDFVKIVICSEVFGAFLKGANILSKTMRIIPIVVSQETMDYYLANFQKE